MTLSQKTEPDNTGSLASPVPSDTLNSVPASNLSLQASPPIDLFESFDMFSNLHSFMAPPKPERTFSDSLRGQQPPSYSGDPFKNEKHHTKNGIQFSSPTPDKSQRPSLPLPDYEALFPRKRHGVMSDTRWEHIIAEVNQRKMTQEDHEGEMSVDGPEEHGSNKALFLKETTTPNFAQHHRDYQESSPAFTQGVEPKQPLIPPKPANITTSKRPLEPISEQGHAHELFYKVHRERTRPDLGRPPKPSVQGLQDTQANVKGTSNPSPDTTLGQIPEPKQEKPTPTARNVLKPASPVDKSRDVEASDLPVAKPRQGTSSKEPVRQVQPEQFTPSASSPVERRKEGHVTNKSLYESFKEGKPIPVNKTHKAVNIPKEQPSVTGSPEKKGADFDPFPSDKLICQDPWALPQQPVDQDDPFTLGQKKGEKPKDQKLFSNDFDDVFGPVASKVEINAFYVPKDQANVLFESVAFKNESDFKKAQNLSPSSQKVNSQKKKIAPRPPGKSVMVKDTVDRQVSHEDDDDELIVNSLPGPESGDDKTAFAELLPGSAAGGKSTLCAWVSPSEIQTGTTQSPGGGGVLTSRR